MASATTIHLSDYRPYPFAVPSVKLDVVVLDHVVQVTSSLAVEPVVTGGVSHPMVLKGVGLDLQQISIDGHQLASTDYSYSGSELVVLRPPTEPFSLTTVCCIDPFANGSLEGLYASGGMLTTQCEAEGFRRITFHPHRDRVELVEVVFEPVNLLIPRHRSLQGGHGMSRERLITRLNMQTQGHLTT